jgi:hypothetical protein
VDDYAAGFVRRVDGSEAALRASVVWWERLLAAAKEGFPPLEAPAQVEGCS